MLALRLQATLRRTSPRCTSTSSYSISQQTWGATHAHFPFSIFDINGFAGREVVDVIGHAAVHPPVTYNIESPVLQQSNTPHA